MRFADIKGNEAVKRALVNMADTGRVAHAMLFFENEGCGAFPMALAYLQYLHCSDRQGSDSCGECPSCRKISKLIHPDVHFVYPVNSGSKCTGRVKDITSDTYIQYFREMAVENPYFMESDLSSAIGIEGKTGAIAVQEAKQIIDILSLSPVENGWKTIVCYLPEKMNIQAANKLLKMVEEPPEKSLFLFITHNPDKVLQTIFSRCQSSRLLPLSKDDVAATLTQVYGIDYDLAQSSAALAGGSVGAAIREIRNSEDTDTYVSLFSSLMNAVLSRDLCGALDAGDSIAALGSREKQKAFCNFASECVRKIFLVGKGLDNIAAISPKEREIVESAAYKCSSAFCVKALQHLDNASRLVDRNVNQKMIFCDLVDRFYLGI